MRVKHRKLIKIIHFSNTLRLLLLPYQVSCFYQFYLENRLASRPSRRDEETPEKFRIAGKNSHSDVWARICKPGRGTCSLLVLMNKLMSSNKRRPKKFYRPQNLYGRNPQLINYSLSLVKYKSFSLAIRIILLFPLKYSVLNLSEFRLRGAWSKSTLRTTAISKRYYIHHNH